MSSPTDYLQSQYTLERINQAYYVALETAALVENRLGAAAFFARSAKDEGKHARRIKEYMVARNLEPVIETLPSIPAVNGKDYLDMFKRAMKRENATTQSLKEKSNEALTDGDWQTVSFFVSSQGDWPSYHQEQTDSELELKDYITQIDRCGKDEAALEFFDLWLLEQMKEEG